MTDPLRERVQQEIATLEPGGFVILGEPEPPPRGGLGGLFSRPEPTRFVQLRRDEDREVLVAEVVGAEQHGGPYPFDEGTIDAVRSLGWPAPGDPDWEPMGGPAFRRFLPWNDLEAAADLVGRTLEAIGLEPADVETTRG